MTQTSAWVKTVRPPASLDLLRGWGRLLWCGFFLAYAGGVLWIDYARPPWFDEILTIYLSRLPAPDLWRALARGADGQPPLSYLLTSYSFRLFGESPFSARLPESIAFLVFLACVYHFVARRTSRLYGALALLFPLTTLAGAYSYEARPYAILLACCGLALVCWQRAASGESRWWSLPGLGLAVAAGVSAHFFAVLLILPIACGELARWWRTRRIDWAVMAALLLGLSPMAFFAPLIAAGRAYAQHFWNKTGPSFLGTVWTDLFGPAIPCFLLASAVLVFVLVKRRNTVPTSSPLRSGFLFEEAVSAFTLLFLPVWGYLLAATVTGTVHPRYVLGSVAGAAIVAAGLAHTYDRPRPLLGEALLGSLVVLSAVYGAYQVRHAWALHRSPSAACLSPDVARSGGKDVVVASPFDFANLSYERPGGSARFVYLADPELSVRQIDSDTTDRLLMELSRWAPLSVEGFQPYLANHPEFLFLVSDNNGIWSLGELRDRHADFQEISACGGFKLFRVGVRPALRDAGNASR